MSWSYSRTFFFFRQLLTVESLTAIGSVLANSKTIHIAPPFWRCLFSKWRGFLIIWDISSALNAMSSPGSLRSHLSNLAQRLLCAYFLLIPFDFIYFCMNQRTLTPVHLGAILWLDQWEHAKSLRGSVNNEIYSYQHGPQKNKIRTVRWISDIRTRLQEICRKLARLPRRTYYFVHAGRRQIWYLAASPTQAREAQGATNDVWVSPDILRLLMALFMLHSQGARPQTKILDHWNCL